MDSSLHVDIAWAAGMFEGEGTIRIRAPTRRNYGDLTCSVVNTDHSIPAIFQAQWPGHIKAKGRTNARHRPALVWIVAARRAALFLLDVLPYLKTERMRERAILGLAFQAQKTLQRRHDPADYLERQRWFFLEMRQLNQRGQQPQPHLPNSAQRLTMLEAQGLILNLDRLRMQYQGAATQGRTHCWHGHPRTPENTRVSGGKRYCIPCQRRWNARRREEQHAHVLEIERRSKAKAKARRRAKAAGGAD